MEKSLPANLDAERATLGSILLNREAIVAIAPWLPPAAFYLEKHAWIYEAMLACYNTRVPPDTRTVSDELRRHDRLDPIGGITYLADLVDAVPTSYHVEYYARIVERTALLRQLIVAGGKIAALGYDEQDDLEATLDKAESTLFEVSQRRSNQDFIHVGQIIDSYYEQINYLQEHHGEVVGVPTGFRDMDEITGGLQRSDLIILAARPSVGKCLAAWTLIDDPITGARSTIEQCVRQHQPTVYGVSELGEVRPAMISAWIDSGIKPCYRVRTRSGRTLDATANHPFLTAQGWLPLSELTAGRAIAVPRVVPVFGNDESWPIELVRLLAYFIAEGSLTASSPGFTNTDPLIVDDFKSIIAQHFPTCAIRQHKITYYASRRHRGRIPTENPVYAWLSALGLRGKTARDKFLPACVWTWNQRYLAEFLRVLMSCDGSIYEVGGFPRIEFTIASQQLATDVHHAFIRFGLIAKFYQKKPDAWRVEITDPESIQRYQDQIGWVGEKSTRFVDMARVLPLRRRNNGHAPRETWELVRAAAQSRGLSMIELARRSGETTRFGKLAGYNPHMNRSLPQTRLAGYAAVLEDSHLRRLANPDIYWDEISSIEYIGEHQVYDLTVPEGANFIAQDICAHNTSFALSLAYNVATISQATVGVFSLEMSREQLVQRLLALDTGINTHTLRTGHIRDTELQVLMEAMGRLASTPLYIEDTPGLSVMEVRSKARRLQSQSGVDLIIIDYLQLMSGRRTDNRVQEVSEISRGLKSLARELNVPVIALSQLSRAVEGRTSHIPMLSDLRESGCLAGDTLIYLPDRGIYQRIDELVGQSGFNVLALNDETWKLEPRPVLRTFATGHKPIFKLVTRLGRTIRATTNHKFLTIQGWKRLDELAPGMRLALPQYLHSLSADIHSGNDPDRDHLAMTAVDTARSSVALPAMMPLLVGAIPRCYPATPSSQAMVTTLPGIATIAGDHQGSLLRCDDGDNDQRLRNAMPDHMNGDVYWDEISSIEPDGEADVYDLTVEGLHNFVANDIVAHNSIEQDADIVMFIYREELYDKETDKKGIAEIHIAKHRNGPIGVVPMRFDASTTRFMDLTYRTPDGY